MDNTNVRNETFTYGLHNRVLSSSVSSGAGTPTPVTQSYDIVGDITCKSDVVGTACGAGSTGYVYGGANGGPHAVTAAGANSYGYDNDGNMTSRTVTVHTSSGDQTSSQTMSWNSDDLPTAITQDAGNYSNFTYAPDKHRYKQVAMVNGAQETTVYAGGLEIVTDSTGTHYRHTISAYGKPVLLETLENNTGTAPVLKQSYTLTDHLGSVDTVVNDADTSLAPRESFDAFGQRRDAGTWNGPMAQADLSNARNVTHHGFTHHEQLDNLAGLIHANGRVLDSVTGRFLSVDPIFQAPTNSQSVNPYSYVMNNSLSLVDPSGYAAAASPDGMTFAEKSGGPRGGALAYGSVTIDFGMGGSIGGEGGRDADGNLIQRVDLDSLQAGEGVQLANGTIIVKNDAGNFEVYGGNGASSGDTAPASTTSSNTNGNTEASGSAAVNATAPKSVDNLGLTDDQMKACQKTTYVPVNDRQGVVDEAIQGVADMNLLGDHTLIYTDKFLTVDKKSDGSLDSNTVHPFETFAQARKDAFDFRDEGRAVLEGNTGDHDKTSHLNASSIRYGCVADSQGVLHQLDPVRYVMFVILHEFAHGDGYGSNLRGQDRENAADEQAAKELGIW